MKKYILILSIIAICAFFLGYCNRSEILDNSNTSPTIDSLARECAKMDLQKKALVVKLDSMANLIIHYKEKKTVYITRYKDVLVYRDSIGADSIESVKIFDWLVNACDSVNSVNDSIISQQDQAISTQAGIIDIQESQLSIKDSIIKEYKDQSTKDNSTIEKQAKQVKRNRIIAGIATGIAAIEAGVILLLH